MEISWKVRLSSLILAAVFCIAIFLVIGCQENLLPNVAPGIEMVESCSLKHESARMSYAATRAQSVLCDDAQLAEDAPVVLEGKELYVFYIHQICEEYYPELDPAIVQAVMETESHYIPTVESRCGAVGLMQVIPKWHAWRMEQYGLTDIWDPYTNIIVGIDFLNESYAKYGDYYQALIAYNNSSSYANYVLALADEIR